MGLKEVVQMGSEPATPWSHVNHVADRATRLATDKLHSDVTCDGMSTWQHEADPSDSAVGGNLICIYTVHFFAGNTPHNSPLTLSQTSPGFYVSAVQVF